VTTYISDTLRNQVRQRAGDTCEYCLLADHLSAKHHEVDHIHAEKHGGATALANLCLSCYYCNHFKGPVKI
jgi:5-methylcytosine-specific restriction endonuclease McrA